MAGVLDIAFMHVFLIDDHAKLDYDFVQSYPACLLFQSVHCKLGIYRIVFYAYEQTSVF